MLTCTQAERDRYHQEKDEAKASLKVGGASTHLKGFNQPLVFIQGIL